MFHFKFRLATLFGIKWQAVNRLAKVVLVAGTATTIDVIAVEIFRHGAPAFLNSIVISLGGQPVAVVVAFGTLIGLHAARALR